MLVNMKYVIIVILLIFHHEVSSEATLIIKEIITKADKIISIIERTIFWVGFLGPRDKTPQETLNTVNEISTKLEEIGVNLNQNLDDLSLNIPQKVYNIIRMENDVKDMEKNIRDINNMYKLYFVHLKNESISNYTVQSFITVATSIGDNGLINKAENIYSLFVPGELGVVKKGCLNIFMNLLNMSRHCNEFHASHQWLYELFSLIKRVETRVLVMVTTAYKMRSVLTNEIHEFDLSMTKNRFLNRMNNYLRLMRAAFDHIPPTDIYRCDARSPMKGETYIELDKLAQRFVLDIKKSSLLEKCESCENIKGSTGAILTSKRDDIYPVENACRGRIVKCKTWSRQDYWPRILKDIEICEMSESSSRRYQWLKDTESRFYGGNTDNCAGKTLYDTPYYTFSSSTGRTFTYPTGIEYLCDHCLCTCLEDGYNSSSIRKFNPEPQISDYKNNMVVIGVQFVKDDDQIINIQIKEGKLMPEGKILPGSERWAPIRKSEDSTKLLEMGYNTNYMNLEDIEIPSFIDSSLVIGVGFHRYNHYNLKKRVIEKAIGIQIFLTEFNFTSGAVDTQYQWLYSYQNQEDDLNLGKADHPLKSSLNLPDSQRSQWVEFQPTDDDLDAGQTVVPFLDIQPVYTDPGFPLRGIGLFHKGAPGYGGYVAWKILTLDMSKFVDN